MIDSIHKHFFQNDYFLLQKDYTPEKAPIMQKTNKVAQMVCKNGTLQNNCNILQYDIMHLSGVIIIKSRFFISKKTIVMFKKCFKK